MDSEPTPAETALITERLGRAPQGQFRIAARNPAGDPSVIRNAPLLANGTPMPTRFWLIDPDETRRIGRLESDGGVDAAEREVDPALLAAAHARYAEERDAAIPSDHDGPRPSGGVGGTRIGVKCLHAHWAWHLAGGDDPVGRWIERRLATTVVEIGELVTTFEIPDSGRATIRWGSRNLLERWLLDDDPPHPVALTNALGTVSDELDDVERDHPQVFAARFHEFRGDTIDALAWLELGTDRGAATVPFERAAAEEVFRLVATESTADRAHNPGLPFEHVETILGTCCIVVAVMRRWQLTTVDLVTSVAARRR